jgi:pyruvate/2-oxoacid:ferredoxin oxidoreductase alpha subunit
MAMQLVTGNHAAGYALFAAGEANRNARGCTAGAYPITPQTEIIEFLLKQEFSKGRVIPVESEHSAMGVCIGASLAGARSFTASSSNGLAYMTENVFNAGYYRLPIVMVAVNRTLGPPWNIWSDQGDTLALRDAPWIQFYCDTHQDIVDTTLLAFRLGEDRRVLLPVLVSMDAFILSHTTSEADLPEQSLVDRFLPICAIPHMLNPDHPATTGGLIWPRETASQRWEIDQAFRNVRSVLEQARGEFADVFGRSVGGSIVATHTEDADVVLVACGAMACTARDVVQRRRASGERVGFVRVKMFRPFPGPEILAACRNARKIAVLDRNYAPGVGGIFWHDLRAAAQGRGDLLIQNYLIGLCGMDATPELIDEVIDDLSARQRMEDPVWKGLEP